MSAPSLKDFYEMDNSLVWRWETEEDILNFERFMSVLAGRLYHRNVMSKINCPYCAVNGWVIPQPVQPWWVRFFNWCSGAAFENHRRP